MNNSWIKWHRKLLTNPVFRHDRTAWHIFEVLTLSADYQTGVWEGGRFQLAAICDEKSITVYKALKRLEKAEMVTLKSNNRFTRIHICKWSDYQASGNTSEEQHGNNTVTTGEQPDNTLYRNNNKEKKKKESEESKDSSLPVKKQPNPEINQAFGDWQETTGIALTSNVTRNRFAASNLLKKHGVENVGKLIKLVAVAQTTEYAPRIADFCQLQKKLPDLLVWAKREGVAAQKSAITNLDDYR